MKNSRFSYRLFAATIVTLALWMLPTAAFAAQAANEKPAAASDDKQQANENSAEEPKGDAASPDEQSSKEQPTIPPLGETLQGSAKTDYEAGKLLFQSGDFAGAFIKFQKAYEESHDGRLLWNMAVCQNKLRHYVKLLKFVERYKREAAHLITEDDKKAAEVLINTVKQFVSPVSITSNVQGAQVLIDGKLVGQTPLAEPVLVDMGKRTITVKKEGYVPYERTLEIPGNTNFNISAPLVVDKNEGTLQINAKPGQTIWVDGKPVGNGLWQGTVTAGSHTVRVSAKGMRSYQSEVVVPKHGTKRLHITLEKEVVPVVKEDSSAWMWITGGAVLMAGAGVGAYFLLRPAPEPEQAPPAVKGTISPGYVSLP